MLPMWAVDAYSYTYMRVTFLIIYFIDSYFIHAHPKLMHEINNSQAVWWGEMLSYMHPWVQKLKEKCVEAQLSSWNMSHTHNTFFRWRSTIWAQFSTRPLLPNTT